MAMFSGMPQNERMAFCSNMMCCTVKIPPGAPENETDKEKKKREKEAQERATYMLFGKRVCLAYFASVMRIHRNTVARMAGGIKDLNFPYEHERGKVI